MQNAFLRFLNLFPQEMKNRTLSYLFDRYLGHFLQKKLTQDQLSVNIIDGKGCINSLFLDVDSLNKELSFLPFHFVDDCSIREISFFIPWSSLLTKSCTLDIDGATLICNLFSLDKIDPIDQSDYLSKSFMSSSMEMAKEIYEVEEEKEDKVEGLEIFARLIDSVLRRVEVFATNTTFIIRATEGPELHFSVKYFKCENCDEDDNADVTLAPKFVCKKLTIENVDVVMDGDTICQICGKHTMELNVKDGKCDVKLSFASFLLAFLNNEQIDKLITIFSFTKSEKVRHTSGDKLMSSSDYAKIEEQLQRDVENVLRKTNCINTLGGNSWTAMSNETTNELKFLPLGEDRNQEQENTLENFTCAISLPGLIVFLRNNTIQFPSDSNIFSSLLEASNLNSLRDIKSAIEQIFEAGLFGIMLIAMPLKIHIKENYFHLVSGDVSVVEHSNKRKEMIFETAAQPGIHTPNFEIEIIDQNISLLCKTCIRMTIDLTFLERSEFYYRSNNVYSDSTSPSDWMLKFNCNTVNLNFLFPIPDLRTNPESFSSIRDEHLEIILQNVSLETNLLKLEMCLDSLIASFVDGESFEIVEANGGSEKIKFVLKNGPSAFVQIDNLMDETEAFFAEQVGPFQTKRNIIKSSEDDNEPIVTPNDLEGSIKYFESCQSLTQFQLEITGYTCIVKIKNKQIMDKLFNRFGNDYALWRPLKAKYMETNSNLSIKNQAYFACQSGLADSLDSEASFHSLNGNVNRLQNLATCTLRVNKLEVDMLESKHIITSQNVFFGFVLGLDDCNTNMISLHGNNVIWSYNNVITIAENSLTNSKNSLNMTFEIVNNQSKKIKFAVQLIDAFLTKMNFEAFTDFWDIIDVTNEGILGYVPLQRETELHVNIVNSGIVYNKEGCRDALITFEGCYITSMVVENTKETVLRVIIEESCLHFKKNNYSSELCKSYVTIVDSGLIDLNLKFTCDQSILGELEKSNSPKIDFIASNNVINVKVCNDSLDALLKLLILEDCNEELPSYGEAISREQLSSSLVEDAINDIEEKDVSPLLSLKSRPTFDDDGFWILGDDDIGAGIKSTSEPQIRILTKDPIFVDENHFPMIKTKTLPESLGKLIDRYLLKEMTLMIYFYGGKDFEDEPIKMEEQEDKNEPELRFPDSSMDIWENIDLKSNAEKSHRPINCRNFGGKHRQNDVCVQLSLIKIKAVFDKFDKNSNISWRFSFVVQDIAIIDRVYRSKIKKMLYSLENRTNSTNMFSLKAVTMRNSIDNQEECDLKISMKPLRINIDQDTVLFLIEYFNQLGNKDEVKGSSDGTIFADVIDNSDNGFNASKSALYVKSFLFSPDVPIRLDYHGKRLDFEQGALPGLLMGLAHLNQSEIRLKKLHNKHGILGLNKVLLYAVAEWYSDIKKHQLPSILGSIGPLNSIRQLVQGIFDLFWIPVDQYRRDRRLVKGLQRGASSFSSSTAIAVIDLANRLVYLIQGTAQFAHDVVSPNGRSQTNYRGQVPNSQPRDFREGVATAYVVMREGLNETYRSVANAGIQAEGYSEAFGEFIRQIPSNMFRPIIKASEATSNVLVGMRNQLTPEARKDDQEKWKS